MQALSPLEHEKRGYDLEHKGKWTEAIHEYETALSMDPYCNQWREDLVGAHVSYGRYLFARNETLAAAAEFRKALILGPDNKPADAELDKAIKSLGKDPNDLNCRVQMAMDAEAAGQLEGAVVEWRRCVRIKDTGSTRAQLGRILLRAGKVVDGYRQLRTAVTANWVPVEANRRELADIHRQLADILREYALKARHAGKGTKGMQRLANAGVEYRRAVTIDPGNQTSVEGLVECGQMAVAIKPSFDNHLYLAGAYLLAGKLAAAESEYKQCGSLGPDRPELLLAHRARQAGASGKPSWQLPHHKEARQTIMVADCESARPQDETTSKRTVHGDSSPPSRSGESPEAHPVMSKSIVQTYTLAPPPPPGPDISIEEIVVEEPVALPDFPPFPLALDLPISAGYGPTIGKESTFPGEPTTGIDRFRPVAPLPDFGDFDVGLPRRPMWKLK